MNTLFGLIKSEYRMMIGRRGPWLAYGVVFLFHSLAILQMGESSASPLAALGPWWAAGEILYILNLFMPLIAGISAADRLARDRSLKVRELQRGAPLPQGVLLAGKFLGVLAAALTPNLFFISGIAAWAVLAGIQPALFFPSLLAGFAAITIPAFAFVIAFSLACPLVIPIRVYQVLLTGYWFWGNYLPPDVFPTLNGTLLTPAGVYALQGFFGGRVGINMMAAYTAGEAVVNIAILLTAVFAVLALASRFLAWRERES
uniref:Uncharacterized protein n=1 Tax=uncultured Aminicenantes bacterium TaxID=174294 RepID=Q2YZY4_9BACT|nr:hypothetical protein [uncultured Aminicenantes bacterium]